MKKELPEHLAYIYTHCRQPLLFWNKQTHKWFFNETASLSLGMNSSKQWATFFEPLKGWKDLGQDSILLENSTQRIVAKIFIQSEDWICFCLEIKQTDEPLVTDQDIFLHHQELTQENIMVWYLDQPMDLSLSISEKLQHTFQHLRLGRLIKSVSGFLAHADPASVEGKKASELFELGEPSFLESMTDFFSNNLILRNKVVPLKSKEGGEPIVFLYNWRGFTQNGKLVRVLYSSMNITEQEKQRFELENTKYLLNEAQNLGRMGAWSLWPSQNKAWFSNAFYEITAFRESDQKQMYEGAFFSRIEPSFRAPLYRAILRCIRYGEPIDTEIKLISRQDYPEILRIKAEAVKDPYSDEIRINGMILDITDYTQIKNELQQKLNQFEQFSNAVPGGLFIFEVDKQGNYSTTLASKKAYDLIEQAPTKDGFQLNNYVNALHEDDRAAFLASIEEAVQEVKVWDHTHRMVFDGARRIKYIRGISTPELQSDGTLKFYGIFVDVTNEEEKKQALYLANQKYELAASAAELGIWEYNISSGFIYLDENLYELFGLEQSVIVTHERWKENVLESDFESFMEKIDDLIQSGGEVEHLLCIIEDNEIIRYLRIRAKLLQSDADDELKVLGVAWDVSSYMAYQQELEESNLRALLTKETAQVGTWEWNLIDDTVHWDDIMYDILQMTKGQPITPEVWFAMVAEEDREKLQSGLDNAISGLEPLDILLKVNSASGDWIYFKSRARVQFDHRGKAVKMVGVGQDFTQLISYQKSLEDTNLKYRLATRTRRFGLWEYDPATKLLNWEDSQFEMYGIPQTPDGKIPISTMMNVVHDNLDALVAEFDVFIKEGQDHLSSTFSIKRPLDGEIRYIESVATAQRDEFGEVQRIIGLNWDVTEDREREISLKNIIETREKLFNVIAHDLKGPISNLIGITDLLSTELPELSKEEVLSYIQMIKKSSSSASDLLRNLLIWSRNISNRIPFKPEMLSLKELIEEQNHFFAHMASIKKINLKFEADKLDTQLFADKHMLQTILRNLIANAIKFTAPGGTVNVTSEKVDNYVQICIIDSGIGMSRQQLKELFKVDGKVQRTGTHKEKGSGLGLLIVKDFMERHKGHIHVSSEVNKGSTFSLQVPMP